MIKKLLFIFWIFSLAFYNLNVAFATTNEAVLQIDRNEKSFFGKLSEIKELNNTLAKLEIDLRYLNDDFENEHIEKINLNNEKIEQLKLRLLVIAKELDEHKRDPENDPALPEILDKETKSINEEIERLSEEMNILEMQKEEADNAHEQELESKRREIRTVKSEIEKSKEIAKNQFIELLKKFGLFTGLIITALISRKIVTNTIVKHGKNLSKKRKEILIKITNISVGSLIGIAILAILFSQIFVILPFLALLGTGLAFAIRDVISSFIAWFFIGANHGYKIGDIIEVDKARGKVLDIHLIHTEIQETGTKGPSGKIITIPNKMMFEKEIKNFSTMFRFTWVMFDFLLEKNSNVQKVKMLLLEIINELIKEDIEEISKNLPSLARIYNISEETIKPDIFVDLEEKGIRISVKFFCRLPQRHSLRSKISEIFLERIAQEKDIHLRFLSI